MKFSIIVPVYNVEKYVKQCINSILSQTYINYELILVDDGSTDSSGSICDSFKNNKLIKVFHKKNGGLSDARNYGFKKAEGEYVIFLDSDDYWIDNDFLSNINKMLIKKNYDLIIFNTIKYFDESEKKSNPRFNIIDKTQKYSKEYLI